VTLAGLDLVFRQGVTWRARDGVPMIADLWHPVGPGPFPALLVRTAYGRALASAVTSPHPSVFARHGYLVASVDVRGRGDSGGEFVPFAHEADDGEDAVGWLAGLPECDGRVGCYGFSYQGTVQLLTAARRPRALRAIAPGMTSANPAEGFLFHNGILRLGYAASWASQLAGADGFLGGAAAGLIAERIAAEDVPTWPFWSDWLAGRCGPVADVARIDVPALVTVGWFDTFGSGGVTDLAALGAHGHLHAAPWSHMPWSPDLDDSFAMHLAFFDRHVAGRPGPPVPPARTLAIGAGWRDLPGWPPPAEPLRLWLSGAAGAATRWGTGRLTTGEEPGPPGLSVFQPAVPVPVAGGAASRVVGSTGQADQGPVQDLTEVLVFTGQVLDEALEIAGSPIAHLALSSTAPSTDGCVTLCDVAPDGSAVNVAFGAARGDGVVDVVLGPVHTVIPAGHRVRVAVAPSAFPELQLNRSAGWAQVTRALGTGSWVELPVVTPA